MPYYAQVDESGIVHTVSQLAGVVEAEDMIPIAGMDTSVLSKRYNPGTGQFEEPEPEE